LRAGNGRKKVGVFGSSERDAKSFDQENTLFKNNRS